MHRNLSAWLSECPKLKAELELYLAFIDLTYEQEDYEDLSSEFLNEHQELKNSIDEFNIWRETVGLLVSIFLKYFDTNNFTKSSCY